MFDDLQTLENPALRTFLNLPKTVTGIVVHRPYKSEPDYPLKQWDVITKIGETAVDDQGMIKLGPDLRVFFQYMIQKAVKNNQVPLTVMRAGQESCINLPLISKRARVIPVLDGAYPSYFVYGPIVFSSATVDMVRALTSARDGSDWPSWLRDRGSPLLTRLWDKPAFEGERLVVISSKFFPHKLANGYSDPFAEVLKSVNGVAVKNLLHLVELLRDSKDEYLRFEFNSRAGEAIVFNRAAILGATDEILADNALRSQGSPDVLAIWNSKH
jgi:hypothetical protein